ncbi:DUF3626 domain-containing protein [Streptomyces mirabilis]|uniref:DUF3626 domain-containing protein n=1 Tax=Streptomyces mirabilis TaxID=68239 RepID=UPI003673757A
MDFRGGRTPQERALRHVAALSRGAAVDPALRITLNFHPDRLVGGLPILEVLARDGAYVSQFVTGTSNGGLTAHPGGDRRRWESRIFGAAYRSGSPPTTPPPSRPGSTPPRRPTGVTYGVLGVGDRNWAATYQHVPARIDERLAEGGRHPAAHRAAGAVRRPGRHWHRGTHGGVRGPGADRRSPGRPRRAARAAPHDRHRGLRPHRAAHPRTKRFVRLALPDGTTYRTGDHLTVLPVNDPALVERTATALGSAWTRSWTSGPPARDATA